MSDTTFVRTGREAFDSLVPTVRAFLAEDVFDIVVDGKPIRGYRTPDARSLWIRDYSDMLRGVKYFEPDVKSVVEHFAETQAATGRVFDYVTTFPEKLPGERENWTKYVRVPVEADVEYRLVKAAFLAWQASGDDEWIRRLMSPLEKAMDYVLTHPWRHDPKTGLVKRAYTIDTWDFAYTAGKHEWLQFQIDDDTFWGIMHGDNSGTYEAFRQLAFLHDHLGDSEAAALWTTRADKLRARMNEVCWNGRFYTHFVKLTPVDIPGVDEDEQLSLSNPMNINRGTTTHEMAVSILEEYRRREEASDAFAGWFSIDPPFPDGVFGDEKLKGGAYVNGGIMPLVGGELARAAFEHGFEAYGAEILARYHTLIAERGETYLWYQPDGTPASLDTSTSPDAMPTDAWGSTAMLHALMEGLAGIEDRHACLRRVRLAPRWAAAGIDEAEAAASYASSGASIGYQLRRTSDGIGLDIEAAEADIDLHLLLPEGATARSVTVNGDDVDHANATVRNSNYVDCRVEVRGTAEVRIGL